MKNEVILHINKRMFYKFSKKKLLYYIIKINGIYDILCALSILKIINIPYLENLHLSMIKDYDKSDIFKRFLAYWIFTYGIIRIGSYPPTPYSYYIEALCFANEYIEKSVYKEKTIFVISSSLLLGCVSHLIV